jgi:hypothetical protein
LYLQGINKEKTLRRKRTAYRFFGEKTDRIEKAVELIANKHVSPVSEGSFAVYSQSENGHYKVTLISCQCHDFHFNTELCKHQWASWGAAAAQLILKIRSAYTYVELEGWASQFADLLCDVPEHFLVVVREEYRKRLAFIYSYSEKRRAS